MPEFQAVLAQFRRPEATMALLTQHAFGLNWPLACAAFTVLAGRPERDVLGEPVIQHLTNLRPYVILYALEFLTSLETRPPVGAVVLAAHPIWPDNAVIPDFVLEYFARSAALGDRPDFGDRLAKKPDLDLGVAIALLGKIQHPFAPQLLAALTHWKDTRLDRAFLGEVGTVWGPDDREPFLTPAPAWDDALAQAFAAISQRRPRSVLVRGDPRIGKTAFIGLLDGVLRQDGWTLFAAGGAELMADQIYIGQLEGRIRKVVEALHPRRKVVWYVRDLAQLADSGTHRGQSASILDQILPDIAAGNLILVGECGDAVATRLLEARPSLRSLLEIVRLRPMDDVETMALAMEVGVRIRARGGPEVTRQAVAAAMDLTRQYLGAGQLPGAVLDLLKRAAIVSAASNETAVTAQSIIATLSQISGLPTVILDTGQKVELAAVRAFFAGRVIGQDEAAKAMVDRIAMLKAGLIDPTRPIGVFLFAGPTGTGKTEMAKTLAEFLFGSASRMIRLDMSEFQAFESTAKILGQRGDGGPGSAGGGGGDSLIDRIRKQPFSVVLLDEFEKAHPACWDLFLQIFDDGRLSDANGREADFRHSIIILTSNLGATAHRGGGLGFRPDPGVYGEDQVLRAIHQTFRPEFVNRLDRIIVFRPLTRDLMRTILHKELADVLERRGLRERDWAVEFEPSAIDFLLERGFSPEMGARPLKRAIDQLLLAPLAATLVEHRFPAGDQFLFVRANGREIEVEFVDPDAEPTQGGEADAPEAGIESGFSLPAIVLSQSGSAAERAALGAQWRDIGGELAGPEWTTKVGRLRAEMADPDIWSRDDRHRVFSGLELADRVVEASRTAERLFRRYDGASERTSRASRELAGRLALQLYNVRQGLDDFAADAPVDALLRVEPVLDGEGDRAATAAWCARLTDMYRGWAARRRMRIEEIAPAGGKGLPILLIAGFGAYRALSAEAGLHVWEEGPGPEKGSDTGRVVARVTAAPGPEQDLPPAGRFAAAAKQMAESAAANGIVRRYRESPTPLVRDVAGGWRSGRLAAILAGDFDLIGASKGKQARDF
jgi:ATP-dependent Clp protease ATP-binding subunit ClpC